VTLKASGAVVAPLNVSVNVPAPPPTVTVCELLMAMAGDDLDPSGTDAGADEPVLSAAELVELAELESVEAIDEPGHPA